MSISACFLICMCILWCPHVRSSPSRDKNPPHTKLEFLEDTPLQSPTQGDDSSHAEWVSCVFITMSFWLFTCSFTPFIPHMASSENNSVMLTPCPDPDLAVLYENLPVLPYVCICHFLHCFWTRLYLCLFTSQVCDIKSFTGCSESPRTSFAEKCEGLAPETTRFVHPLFIIIIMVPLTHVALSGRSSEHYISQIGASTSTPLGLIPGCCMLSTNDCVSPIPGLWPCVLWLELSLRVSWSHLPMLGPLIRLIPSIRSPSHLSSRIFGEIPLFGDCCSTLLSYQVWSPLLGSLLRPEVRAKAKIGDLVGVHHSYNLECFVSYAVVSICSNVSSQGQFEWRVEDGLILAACCI